MTIARVRGVPVYVHWTLGLLLAAWVGFAGIQGWSMLASAVVGVLFFASVLAHEVGHVVVAQRYGVVTRRIVLLPIGGAAQMERRPLSPLEDLMISLAGPAVNLGIGAVLLPLGMATGIEMLVRIGLVNLALGLFNLIPAFPMDGGRVLRAVLTELFGADRASDWTLAVGGVFATAFFVLGSLVPEIGLLLLAIVMGTMQWREYRVQRRLRVLQGA